MLQQNIPDHASTIVIPVANPDTAPQLLRFASALLEPDGRIVAVVVIVGDAEERQHSIESVKPIIENAQQEGLRVELLTVEAATVSRGILDAVREQRADLLILGMQQPKRGEVTIGAIAENVTAAAPCDVLIYRASQTSEFERVVVWANGGESARIANQTGIRLAEKFGLPVECMLVQSHNRSYWQGMERLEDSLAFVHGKEHAKRTVVTADHPVAGLLSRINPDDLLVMGFSRRTELERWLFGDVVRQLLNRAPGAMLLSARSAENHTEKRFKKYLGWAVPTLTPIEQDELVRQARENATPSLDYIVLILVSAVIAALGLLLNSAAVVIGAMLIAPLMQPLTALATGMATGRLRLIERSLGNLALGVLLGMGVAGLTGLVIPLDIPTTEMQSRGTPTLIDAGVAFAAGFIGAYANARRGIPAALAGVAIAAALMPPLCTVGLALAFGEHELALGALLLFLTNIGFISLAGWAVYFWLGVRPRPETRHAEGTSNHRRYISLVVVVLLMIPVLYMLYNLGNRASEAQRVKNRLQDSFPTGEIVQVELHGENTPMRVVATLRMAREPRLDEVRLAEEDLEAGLHRDIDLEIVLQLVIRRVQPLYEQE